MTEAEKSFAARAVRRRKLFLTLAVAGVAVASSLTVYYGYRRAHDPAYPVGVRIVVVVLILLNARQNLRQYKFAGLLEKLMRD